MTPSPPRWKERVSIKCSRDILCLPYWPSWKRRGDDESFELLVMVSPIERRREKGNRLSWASRNLTAIPWVRVTPFPPSQARVGRTPGPEVKQTHTEVDRVENDASSLQQGFPPYALPLLSNLTGMLVPLPHHHLLVKL
jgi:hypothetical protein